MMGVSESSFNDIENEAMLLNELVLSAKQGHFARVFKILGEPSSTKKAHLLNCIPDNRRWGVLHQAVFWNDPNILKNLLKYSACDSDMRAKRCTSECGSTSGMCALEIAQAYKYPVMEKILSEHSNNILAKKLPTFQKQPCFGLFSNTIAAYKSTFHPGYISPLKTILEILNDIWENMNSNNVSFFAVKEQVCDAMHSVSSKTASRLLEQTSRADFYGAIVNAYSIEKQGDNEDEDDSHYLYNNLSTALRRQTRSTYKPTGEDMALGPYAILYQMILLFWEDLRTESGTTYRQMKMLREDLDMYREGAVFYWQSVVSSTTDRANARSFPTCNRYHEPGDNTVLFKIDNSTKCIWQPKNIETYAAYKESERTYPAGAKFRVTSGAKFRREKFEVKLALLEQ